MTTTVVDRAMLDTNVLLAATDTSRTAHELVIGALENWPASGVTLYTSGQILREYLAVATRPLEQNGFGLSRPDAVSNVRVLRTRLTLLTEDARTTDRLLHLLDTVSCQGKQVHDANVVATMLVHGVDTVVTLTTSDFARFEGVVRVSGLTS